MGCPAKKIRRVGILTGGGDCPGLNAVIRAVGKTLINQCGVEVVGIEDGFRGLVLDQTRPLSFSDLSNILTLGGTILGSSNKDNPFEFYEDEGGKLVKRDRSDLAVRTYRRHRLDALVCLGGDGTMSMAARFADKGLNIVGVPKTIDNDLAETERTFGFDTAVWIVSEALDRVHTTAASHHRCICVETMGRYAGWIALYAGAASGADVILIPEIPFDPKVVCEVVRGRYKRGKVCTIACIAEGAAPIGGKMIVEKTVATSHDPIRLGGIAKVVADTIGNETGVDARAVVLGHVQRGGTPTPFDRDLATCFGHAAAERVMSGRFGRMVRLKDGKISDVELAKVANKVRKVPMDEPLMLAAKAVGTSFGA